MPLFKFLSFLLALISIIYEFNLAQMISLFYGSTFVIYAITIGLYTFSLGFGAMYYEKIKNSNDVQTLFFTEICLSFSALISPLLVVFCSTGTVRSVLGPLLYFLVFAPVVICGFLSGIELPCLLSLNTKDKESILLWDYVGMFIGSLFFGLFAVEWFGAMRLIWIMGSLNILAVFGMSYFLDFRIKKKYLVLLLGILLFNALFILKEESLYTIFRAAHGF